MNNSHTTLAAVLITALMILASGCGILPREEEEEPPVLVTPVKEERQVLTAKRETITESITLRGRFASAQTDSVYYTTSGRIREVLVKAGDQVRAGQPLIRLHNDDLELQVVQAELRYEKQVLSQEDTLYKAQFSNSATLKNELRRLEIDMELALMDLAKLRQQLIDSVLVAPFAGQVTAVTAKVGDNIQAYAPIVTLSDPNQLIVEADVDDAALASLSVGQQVRLEFSDMGNTPFKGTIVELPETGAAVRRAKIRADERLDQAQMGMVGRAVVILQEKHDAILLPNSAIRQFSGRTYVLMNSPRREVDVVLGILGETETEILRGLNEGDQVIGR